MIQKHIHFRQVQTKEVTKNYFIIQYNIQSIRLKGMQVLARYYEKAMQTMEQKLPHKKLDIFGRDSLMNFTFPYYLLAFLSILGQFQQGQNVFMFIFIVYTVLPLLDQFLSFDLRNPDQKERKELQSRDLSFRVVLYITVIADWAMFFKVMKYYSNLELTPLQLIRIIATIFIFSNLQSVQFAVSHQIFHKPGKFHKYLGTVHMIKNLYMHFTYEHLYGHHRRVATPQDTGSAPRGMNVYQFFWRTLIGSWLSVYRMEKYECKKSFYSNYAILSLLSSFIFTAIIFKVYGTQTGFLFLLSALGSIFYLQAINFIEHYGLFRAKLADGSYEKVTIRHSWNAPHRFTNYLLFKLQRHSDHHENSHKPYQTLLSLQESPHLPHGYTVCIFLALFPGEWRRIMDPLVDEYNLKKQGNINGQVMRTAVVQTRKFIIKLGIITTTMYLTSILGSKGKVNSVM